MKRLTARQWAGALQSLTEQKTKEDAHGTLKNFVLQLRRRRALNLVPQILRVYGESVDAAHGVVRVATVAARALPERIAQELHEMGTEVIIDHKIDPHVIAGVKITMDGVIIDGTVATRLKKLYES